MSAGDPSVEKLRELAREIRDHDASFANDLAALIPEIEALEREKNFGDALIADASKKLDALVADRDRLLETFEKLAQKLHEQADDSKQDPEFYEGGCIMEQCATALEAAINSTKGGKGDGGH